MVIEGIHLVPGYLDLSGIDRATIVQLVIGVEDDQSHLSHFYSREAQTEAAGRVRGTSRTSRTSGCSATT